MVGSATIKLPGIFHRISFNKKKETTHPKYCTRPYLMLNPGTVAKSCRKRWQMKLGYLSMVTAMSVFCLTDSRNLRKKKWLWISPHNQRLWTCPCKRENYHAMNVHGLLRATCLQWLFPAISTGTNSPCQPNPAKHESTYSVFNEWFQRDNSQHIKPFCSQVALPCWGAWDGSFCPTLCHSAGLCLQAGIL